MSPGNAARNAAIIDEVVTAAATALFEGAAMAGDPRSAKLPANAVIAGVVGFTGEKMRGSLTIASTFGAFAALRPPEVRVQPLSEGEDADWVRLRDWASELANQLMGRIKNRLFAVGANLRIASPTAISGATLATATPKSPTARSFVLSLPQGEMWVRWDAILEPDLALSPRTDNGNVVSEGAVLLF